MLLLSVGVGYPARIAAERGPEAWAGAFLALSHVAIAVGFSLLFVFARRVFRPRAPWARALAGAGVLTLLATAVYLFVQVLRRGAIATADAPLSETLLQTVPLMVAYVWTASESLHYHRAMRRRVALGLADAVVSDRFLLWGVMALAATLGVVLNTGAIVLEVDSLSPEVLLPSSVTGLTQTILLVLAFLPPRSYVERLRARAAAAAH
jgi:hypothetical protein